MSGVRIRRAVPGDMAACARVVSTWVGQTGWMPEDLSQEEIEELIREAFPNRDIWVSGEPVDCYMSIDPFEARVGALYCLRTGEGVGKKLLEQAKDGREYLCLTTHVPNLGAQRFYRREGFIETGTEPPTPPDTVPVIRMEWRA